MTNMIQALTTDHKPLTVVDGTVLNGDGMGWTPSTATLPGCVSGDGRKVLRHLNGTTLPVCLECLQEAESSNPSGRTVSRLPGSRRVIGTVKIPSRP